MSEANTPDSATSANSNIRGRWRRPSARLSGKPAPATPSNFGPVENIREIKENLTGENVNGYGACAPTPAVSEPAPAAEQGAPAQEEAAVCVCETAVSETVCAQSAEAQAPCAEAPAPQAEAPAPQAEEAAPQAAPAASDEAFLKTDWREARKRTIGLRPEPEDERPERISSKPYDEKTYHRSERPRNARLHTETAQLPRAQEYAPSRDRNPRNAAHSERSAHFSKKKSLWAKIKAFFGFDGQKPSAQPERGRGRGGDGRPRHGGHRHGDDRRFDSNRQGNGDRPYRHHRRGRRGRGFHGNEHRSGERRG